MIMQKSKIFNDIILGMKRFEFSTEDAGKLTDWFSVNKRNLPWRDTGDPYDVWISEIMLQQTRIEAVRDKFIQFTEELPDIDSLAECEDDRLMRLWEGLGYYSRARNLKKCAVVLKEKYDSRLPADYDALLALPGIGPYTAAAVASIAFGIPVTAVDGNVLRVIARYFGITDDIRQNTTKKTIEDSLADVHQDGTISPSLFTQGLMELGQMVCVPKGKPKCEKCPLSHHCSAYREQTYDSIPYRSPLKKRKVIGRTILVIRDADRFLLHKRPEGLLGGLYEFPGTDRYLSSHEAMLEAEKMGFTPLRIKALPEAVHIFTHLEWHMKAFEITCGEITELSGEDYILLNKKELQSYAVPSAFRTYVNWYEIRD